MKKIANCAERVAHFLNYNFEKYVMSKMAKVLLGNEVSGYDYTAPREPETDHSRIEASNPSSHDGIDIVADYFRKTPRYNELSVAKEITASLGKSTEHLEARITQLIEETTREGPLFAREFLIKSLLRTYCKSLPSDRRLPELDELAREFKIDESIEMRYLKE